MPERRGKVDRAHDRNREKGLVHADAGRRAGANRVRDVVVLAAMSDKKRSIRFGSTAEFVGSRRRRSAVNCTSGDAG